MGLIDTLLSAVPATRFSAGCHPAGGTGHGVERNRLRPSQVGIEIYEKPHADPQRRPKASGEISGFLIPFILANEGKIVLRRAKGRC